MLLFGQYPYSIGQTAKWYRCYYYYNTLYTTKHDATCYDADINSTGKTWLTFNLSIVYQVSWLTVRVVASYSKGCDFESRCVQGFFIL